MQSLDGARRLRAQIAPNTLQPINKSGGCGLAPSLHRDGPTRNQQDQAKTMTTTNSRSIHPQQRVSAMNLGPPNETRRPVGVRRWAACIAKILLPAGLFAISLLGVINSP